MANFVIVAIPTADDDVWKVSSEKVPHMTFLFLGEALENPNVSKIIDSVRKKSTSIAPFNLRVDHRGFLGVDEADVLFFSQDIPWQVIDFRAMLLGDVNIRSAYNSVYQPTEWKAHLTLGYPKTPANPDSWDPMVTQYVSFDKVGVWYGDFEGTEIPLFDTSKNGIDENVDPAMAWAAEKVNDILEHYGVKGMRWGTRRSGVPPSSVIITQKGKKLKAKGGENYTASPDAIRAKTIGQVKKKSGVSAISNKDLQTYSSRLNLEQNVKRLDYNKKNAAQKFVSSLLGNTGKSAAQQVANEAASKQVKRLLLKGAVTAAV